MKNKNKHLNPCHPELIKMLHLLIFSQSDYLIQIVDTNSHTKWQTVQIQISSLLLQKPTDLDLHCLQRQGISGFSRTRDNEIYASLVQHSDGHGYIRTQNSIISRGYFQNRIFYGERLHFQGKQLYQNCVVLEFFASLLKSISCAVKLFSSETALFSLS